MTFPPETLMAYADGELDAVTRAAIEAAMQTDPALAAQIEQHRGLRAELGNAFAGVLDEPIPERLLETAHATQAPATKIVDFAAARAAKVQHAPRWSLPQWASIAASLVLGIAIGRAALNGSESETIAAQDGRVIAAGKLAAALDQEIGADTRDDAAVRIGLSYRAKSGEYCRTFNVRSDAMVSGIACREAEAWRVQALTQSDAPAATSQYRMAGTSVPPLILRAVEETIAGEPLDAEGEAAARERHWRD